MAEAIFTDMLIQRGLTDVIETDSAGTSYYHTDELAHPGTLRVLKDHGITYAGRARQVTYGDLTRFDYLIALDETHHRALHALATRHSSSESAGHIARLLDYAPGQPLRDVPDPYDTGRFEEVYALVYQGCVGLLESIRQQHGI
jgi:protein-tyrosine phosphatase